MLSVLCPNRSSDACRIYMPYFLTLDGLGKIVSGPPWRKPPNITRLISKSPCGSIFGPDFLLPMSAGSQSGTPWTLSFLMSPLLMMVFKAMVGAQWSKFMVVWTPRFSLATPCHLSHPSLIRSVISSMSMVPWRDWNPTMPSPKLLLP